MNAPISLLFTPGQLPDLMYVAYSEVNELLDGIREDVDRVEHKFTETGERSVDDVETVSRLALLLRVARSTITL